MFTFEKTAIRDVMIITPQIFGDSRGYFLETYKDKDFEPASAALLSRITNPPLPGACSGACIFRKAIPRGSWSG